MNTGIQWNICLYIIAQHSKGRPEKTKLQKYSHIGPTRAKDWENEKEQKFVKTTQNLRRTDQRDSKLIFNMRVVTPKGLITKLIEMQKKQKHCNYVPI